MISIDSSLRPTDLLDSIQAMWELSAHKILAIDKTCTANDPSPVFTVNGTYQARGWTEWTRGFQVGSALLQFDATDDPAFLELGHRRTLEWMPNHLTHTGVHDHGFNIVSTYGNLWRLIREGRASSADQGLCETALRISGAVQASRWTRTADGSGFIHSFNGAHSLFVDTIRSCRSLALGHLLGHELHAEQDERINLLDRLVQHARNTARFNVWYGQGRDAYDERGRTAHECLFNTANGSYRAPSSQQGYSPFSTWSRGLAWAMLGFAEELEFVEAISDDDLEPIGGREQIEATMREAAEATCDHYIRHACTNGVPYWDFGAPNISRIAQPEDADPFNPHEPLDSSAAAIASQGLLRLGRLLNDARYFQAGLTVLRSLLSEPYLDTDPTRQSLLLHAIYHRPNDWDHVPPGRDGPCNEACMWGDYHVREVAVLVARLAHDRTHAFFSPEVGP